MIPTTNPRATSMFFFTALTILFAIASNPAFVTVVQATPLGRRDVIAPKIITPNASTVWTVGHVETVTWDTSNFPPDSQITNPIGEVILGYQENNSLNLDFEHPLASGFKLRDGSVQLTVPNVPPRDDYIIVLFGDSGNTSPAFTITKITGGSSPSSSSLASGTVPSSSDNAPPRTLVPSSPSSSGIVPGPSSLSRVLTTDNPSQTPNSSTPSLASSSTSSSSASPGASSVSATSSGMSFLTAEKCNMMALTLCMASAILLLV